MKLVEALGQKGRHILNRRIWIDFNNRVLHRKSISQIVKLRAHVQDARAKIAQIKSSEPLWKIEKCLENKLL